jgi:hypothetical protein
MTVPRKTPYVWVTWITKLLAQENHCEWAAWFQAHYRDYEKAPSDRPLEQWTKTHAKMVEEQAAALRANGDTVYVENENSLTLPGQNGGTLSGKPDLVAFRNGHITVIDCKTGQQTEAARQQVLIYMRLLPFCHPHYKGQEITGRVQYRDDVVEIGSDELDTQFKTNLRQMMDLVTGPSAAMRTPSLQECQFCKLTQNDCPDRMEPSAIDHDVF